MNTRSCTEVRADLSAYLEGDLDAGLTGATRAHLDDCAACRSELGLLRLAVGALQRLPDLPPPAAILAGVRARLQPEPWYRRLLDGRQWLLGVPVGAIATVLVVVGISLFQARYPDMPQTVAPGPFPQSPAPRAPETPAEPAPIARPAPAARTTIAERRAARPPAPPARDDLRTKGTPGAAALRQDRAGGNEVAAPASSAVAGADTRDRDRATPAATAEPAASAEWPVPAEPAVPTDRATLEAKVEPVQRSQPRPPAAALQDALREEAKREDNLMAAPSRSFSPTAEPSTKRSATVDEYAAEQPARVRSAPPAKMKEAPAGYARKADTGGASSRSMVSEGQPATIAGGRTGFRPVGSAPAEVPAESAGPLSAGQLRVVCLLTPGGDTVDELTRLLRRAGAGDITVSVLEPQAVRAASIRHRGRLGSLAEPSHGWAVTAGIPQRALSRLLDDLASRSGLRILEQPVVPTAPENPAAALELRITVLR